MDYGKIARGLAMLALLLPLVWWVSGCAIQVQGRASLFQRDLPARTAADERETLLADIRRLEALGCSASNLEAALVAWDIDAREASRRAHDAYAASRVGGRCGAAPAEAVR